MCHFLKPESTLLCGPWGVSRVPVPLSEEEPGSHKTIWSVVTEPRCGWCAWLWTLLKGCDSRWINKLRAVPPVRPDRVERPAVNSSGFRKRSSAEGTQCKAVAVLPRKDRRLSFIVKVTVLRSIIKRTYFGRSHLNQGNRTRWLFIK